MEKTSISNFPATSLNPVAEAVRVKIPGFPFVLDQQPQVALQERISLSKALTSMTTVQPEASLPAARQKGDAKYVNR